MRRGRKKRNNTEQQKRIETQAKKPLKEIK